MVDIVKPKQLQQQPLQKRTTKPPPAETGPVDSKKCATSHDVAFSRATTTVLVRQLFEQCFFQQINYGGGGAEDNEPLTGEAPTNAEDEASRDNEVDKVAAVKEETKETNKADNAAFEPTWIGEPLEPKVGHRIVLAQKI